MKYGYMLPEHESGEGLIRAIKDHPTRDLPDLAPVWARWRPPEGFVMPGVGRFDWRLLEQLRHLTIDPVVYAETTGLDPAAILDGRHDTTFMLMAARSRGAPIRILHEANGHGTFEWQAWPIPLFIEVWQHVADLLHAEGAEVIYCVSARGPKDDDMLERWPGEEYVDIVGFDEFRTRDTERFPPQQWRWLTERLATTGKPVWACETGTEAGTPQRADWLSSLADVEGVRAILVFDRRIETPYGGDGVVNVDDWRWNTAMARRWDRLPR